MNKPRGVRSEWEWRLLNRIEHAGLPAPTVAHRFASPDRRWEFDLAWPELRLAVEVEGATYAQGRHTRGAGFHRDCVKYAEAMLRGWHVLRVDTRMIEDGSAVEYIRRLLQEKEHGDR